MAGFAAAGDGSAGETLDTVCGPCTGVKPRAIVKSKSAGAGGAGWATEAAASAHSSSRRSVSPLQTPIAAFLRIRPLDVDKSGGAATSKRSTAWDQQCGMVKM